MDLTSCPFQDSHNKDSASHNSQALDSLKLVSVAQDLEVGWSFFKLESIYHPMNHIININHHSIFQHLPSVSDSPVLVNQDSEFNQASLPSPTSQSQVFPPHRP
jgi:hypothetical protein